MEINALYYLILSTVMMFAGIYGFFTRRNLLATLISVELMLNATNINFAVFNRYFYPDAFLHALRHCHLGGGNGCGHCHYDKCVP